MGLTPIYGFPYPGVSDSPNGPTQVQALAEAVESDLAATDAAIAALQALSPGYTKLLGGTNRSVDAAAITTTETVISTSGAVSLPAASLIALRCRADFFISQASDRFAFGIRTNNVAGSLERLAITDFIDIAGVPKTFEWTMFYKTTTAETHTWVSTVYRFGGGGNIVCQGGTSVRVEYLGPSSMLPTNNP